MIVRMYCTKLEIATSLQYIHSYQTGFEKIREFYANMCELLAYLEKSRTAARDDNNNNAHSSSGSACAEQLRSRRAASTRGKSMQDKMQMLLEQIANAAQRLGAKANVPGIMVKAELESVLKTFKDVVNDVLQVRDVYRNTMRQKRKMEGEVLSMLHNFQVRTWSFINRYSHSRRPSRDTTLLHQK